MTAANVGLVFRGQQCSDGPAITVFKKTIMVWTSLDVPEYADSPYRRAFLLVLEEHEGSR
jgi:hypothetical protein